MKDSTPNPPTPPASAADDYSDIIHLSRPISKTHPRMDKKSRAAQFAPYATLTGHHDLIAQEEHLASEQTDLDHEITIEPE